MAPNTIELCSRLVTLSSISNSSLFGYVISILTGTSHLHAGKLFCVRGGLGVTRTVLHY